ncbi:cytochrome-c peroxidase [Crocinitomix catalasitica]|uniref:cytochrome-c peroxidase n=1 Tax=Crocinitomix catalasitica TaxID=184607 RepID=UPI00146FB7A5|nr:cytochrome c peroxidase [Crocinitomix catalasitica]
MKKIVLFLLLSTTASTWATSIKPATTIKVLLIENYNKLIQSVQSIQDDNKKHTTNWETKQELFFNARISFKKCEALLTYFDREYIKNYINGAPLPQVEPKAPSLVIMEPAGFQIMEEVLFEEDFESYHQLTDELVIKLKAILPGLQRERYNERMIIEASRESLITIAALGITGFDTPTTINTIAEIKTSVQALEQILDAYASYLNADQLVQFKRYFEKGNSYLINVNFESFDRYGFIKNFINPMYGYLLQVQKELHIETRDLVSKSEFSVNYETTNIFDTDFLNYKYFSQYSNSGNVEQRAELGHLLFFDPIFSHNNQRSCASCHDPELGFSDGARTSLAFDKTSQLKRNAPTLLNSIYNTKLFWDGRVTTPEEQVEHVLFNKNEFNSNYDELIAKLKSCDDYVNKFESAYPSIKDISRYTIVASLSSFIQTLRSFNSDFDKDIKLENQSNPKLAEGFNIFTGKAKCATCHFIPTFSGNVPPLYIDTETEVLGTPAVNDKENAILSPDLGRYGNGRPRDQAPFYKHSVKTPTLRNVALTAPYMHNGVFDNLREVVDFYNIGGGHGWGIAPEHTTLPADSLHLTTLEIDALIFFMEALTDTVGMNKMPNELPISSIEEINDRKIGGRY